MGEVMWQWVLLQCGVAGQMHDSNDNEEPLMDLLI